jgi:hypothetical protein
MRRETSVRGTYVREQMAKSRHDSGAEVQGILRNTREQPVNERTDNQAQQECSKRVGVS